METSSHELRCKNGEARFLKVSPGRKCVLTSESAAKRSKGVRRGGRPCCIPASPRGLFVGVRQARLALFQSRLRRRQPRRQQPER